ncbi:MAG: aromatic aminobenezylarsenical efflux permease ArsG family transporter [Candidatus Omnitrophica bacterium]|nr:aromatic aminobenezylarsenical efflux permease ArsG family transporter [Candidatus Omnitrophota bacterium]
MMEMLVGFLSALWLGILTSISPCPLATNIAAVSFISKKIAHPKAVLLSGVFYSLGRMIAYAVLALAIIFSLLSVQQSALFLQKYMNKLLGPVLIVAGLFLLDILKFNFSGFSIGQDRQTSLAGAGIGGAFALGIIFALSFCPISAALFFGSLIPLSLNHKFGAILPFVYGIGTGLPVFIFSVMIAMGVKSLSQWFDKVTKIELYARKATGIIFVIVGLYYVWVHILSSLLHS